MAGPKVSIKNNGSAVINLHTYLGTVGIIKSTYNYVIDFRPAVVLNPRMPVLLHIQVWGKVVWPVVNNQGFKHSK